jgi:ribonuclease-3
MMDKSLMVDNNYKSILLESVQAKGKPAPRYVVLDENGPDHDKEFVIGVYVDGLLLGTGRGKSKKQAEQFAAENALKQISLSNNNLDESEDYGKVNN